MIKSDVNKETLVFITSDQFGYHTDDYYRAYYARNDYHVLVICYNHGKKKIELPKVKIVYIPYQNKRIKNEITLHRVVNKYIRDKNIKVIYTRFFLSCALFRILNPGNNPKWIMDIRTGAVAGSELGKKVYNSLIRFSTLFFKDVTVISENLAKELRLRNYSIVPLGGQPFINVKEIKNRSMNVMNFLYVGIFDGRKIDDVIKAFCRFYRKYSPIINTKLIIIGYSNNSIEEKQIMNIIANNSDVLIEYVGRVPNMELKKYFSESNIGISYVPKTPWFDVQPPTKTFEYIVNGLFCLATDTTENRLIITENNGLLVQDNEESVFEGMKEIYKKRENYDREKIISNSSKYSWESIYNNVISKVIKN